MVINKAFFEGEHVDQVFVLHCHVDFMLEFVGDGVDYFEMSRKMQDGTPQEREYDFRNGFDVKETLSLKKLTVIGRYENDFIVEQEDTR